MDMAIIGIIIGPAIILAVYTIGAAVEWWLDRGIG